MTVQSVCDTAEIPSAKIAPPLTNAEFERSTHFVAFKVARSIATAPP